MVDNVHHGTPVGQLFAHLATGGGRRVQIDGPYTPPAFTGSWLVGHPGSTKRGSTPYQNPPAGMPGGSGTQTPAHRFEIAAIPICNLGI